MSHQHFRVQRPQFSFRSIPSESFGEFFSDIYCQMRYVSLNEWNHVAKCSGDLIASHPSSRPSWLPSRINQILLLPLLLLLLLLLILFVVLCIFVGLSLLAFAGALIEFIQDFFRDPVQ